MRDLIPEPHIHRSSISLIFFLFRLRSVYSGLVLRLNLSIAQASQFFQRDTPLIFLFLWPIWQSLDDDSRRVKSAGEIDHIVIKLELSFWERALNKAALSIAKLATLVVAPEKEGAVIEGSHAVTLTTRDCSDV